MELTLEQALQKGVEAHKAGQVQDADRYYTAILKAQPKHPDANHNMGVLAVGVGKLEESVPFFKTALEVNQTIAQFWLSYIDALIKLNQIDDAKAVLDQAKRNGLNGERFDQLEHRLVSSPPKNSNTQEISQNEELPQELLQSLMDLYSQRKLQRVFEEAQILIKKYSKSLKLWNLIGATASQIGHLDEAVCAFQKAISINPDDARAYSNMGGALRKQIKLEEAIEAYIKALSIKPDFAEAYYNIGIAYKQKDKIEEAIDAYTKAISLKPDYAEAYINMGNALQKQGKLEEAIKAYDKALSIKPDYAEAYNNMGNAVQNQGRLEEAVDAYEKALSLKPDYAEAYWNLSGTAENISGAKKWVEKCLWANPKHLIAKLTLSALQFYEGNKSDFNTLRQSPLKDHPYMRTFVWAFSLPKLPPLHFHRWALFDHMADLSNKNRPFYEFGVWRGEAFRHLIKTFEKGYGFDTFEGIPEDWHNEKAGTYTSDGNVPKIKGGEFIVGKFEDTLPGFFAEKRPVASVINFDADLYSSTICALNNAKPVIDQHTILIFDEFIINKNWEQDEYKALEEFCANNDYTYEVLAISFYTKQVAVRIVGI